MMKKAEFNYAFLFLIILGLFFAIFLWTILVLEQDPMYWANPLNYTNETINASAYAKLNDTTQNITANYYYGNGSGLTGLSDLTAWKTTGDQSGLSGTKSGSYTLNTTGNLFSDNYQNVQEYTTTVSTALTTHYFRVGRIPVGTEQKDVIVKIRALSSSGIVTTTILIINIAYDPALPSSPVASITSQTAHSYNSDSSTDNGYTIRYARLSADANYWYLDVQKYTPNALTVQLIPQCSNDWEWSTGDVSTSVSAGSYSRSTLLAQGLRGDSIIASSANSATYSNYGVLAGQTLSNSADKTGQWAYVGNIYIQYASTYRYGQSINFGLNVKEMTDGQFDYVTAPNLDTFKLDVITTMPAVASNTAFNAEVPSIDLRLTGDTDLSGDDFAARIDSTTTSSKYIRLYIRLKSNNTHYQVLPENRYGLVYSSTGAKSTWYSYFNYVSDQAVSSSLTAPAQGSIVYATDDRASTLYVPYSGATGAVDLNEQDLINVGDIEADSISLTTDDEVGLFDGVDSHVLFDDPVIGNTSYSVMLWARSKIGGVGTASQFLIDNSDSSYTGAGIQLFIQSSGYLRLRVDDNSSNYALMDSTALVDKAWHQYTVVVDKSSNVSLYIDGVSIGTPTSTSGWGSVAGTKDMRLGLNDVLAAPLDGYLDNIKIYDKALSSAEVSALYSAGRKNYDFSSTDLIGAWKFETSNTTTLVDQVGSNDGTYTNGAKPILVQQCSSMEVDDRIQFKVRTHLITPSPETINMGGSYSSTPGSFKQAKLKIYESDAYPEYGHGITADNNGNLAFITKGSTVFGFPFYVNEVLKFQVTNAGSHTTGVATASDGFAGSFSGHLDGSMSGDVNADYLSAYDGHFDYLYADKADFVTLDPKGSVDSTSNWDEAIILESDIPIENKGCYKFFDGNNSIAWNALNGDYWYSSSCGDKSNNGRKADGNIQSLGYKKDGYKLDYTNNTYYIELDDEKGEKKIKQYVSINEAVNNKMIVK